MDHINVANFYYSSTRTGSVTGYWKLHSIKSSFTGFYHMKKNERLKMNTLNINSIKSDNVNSFYADSENELNLCSTKYYDVKHLNAFFLYGCGLDVWTMLSLVANPNNKVTQPITSEYSCQTKKKWIHFFMLCDKKKTTQPFKVWIHSVHCI